MRPDHTADAFLRPSKPTMQLPKEGGKRSRHQQPVRKSYKFKADLYAVS